MVYTQTKIHPWKRDARIYLGFWYTNGSSNHSQTTRPRKSQQKKNTRWMMNFAVSADLRVKLKESEKGEKKFDLRWEQKKNKKTTMEHEPGVVPIVISALSTVTKGLIQRLEDLEIRGWIETILTTVVLRSVRILRRALETRRNLSFKLQWEINS